MITTAKFFQVKFFFINWFPGAWGLHGGFLINYYILGSKKSREGNLKKRCYLLDVFWLYIGSKRFHLCLKLLSLENPFEFFEISNIVLKQDKNTFTFGINFVLWFSKMFYKCIGREIQNIFSSMQWS